MEVSLTVPLKVLVVVSLSSSLSLSLLLTVAMSVSLHLAFLLCVLQMSESGFGTVNYEALLDPSENLF